MAEKWYAVYRASDGELLSVGTDIANPLPAGVTAVLLAEQPDFAKVEWEPGSRNMRPKPPPPPPPESQLDRIEKKLDDLLARIPATPRVVP